MILNKFFDKTFEAARESALLMYGNDYTKLKGVFGEGDDQPKEEHSQKQEQNSSSQNNNRRKPKKEEGVVFERSSGNSKPRNETGGSKSSSLDNIRKYAARQANTSVTEIAGWRQKPGTEPARPTRPSGSLYSRKDIRPRARAVNGISRETEKPPKRPAGSAKRPDFQAYLDQPVNRRLGDLKQTGSGTTTSNKDESKPAPRASDFPSFMISNYDFTEHPAFRQLLAKGISLTMVKDWFQHIMERGIHPGKQETLFRKELLKSIAQRLEESQAADTAKFILFAGQRGSGKSRLIMKLALGCGIPENKKVAVASLLPQEDRHPGPDLLKLFCKNHGIPYYPVHEVEHALRYRGEWKEFDHLLIDTPSVDDREYDKMRRIAGLRQELEYLDATETHYVIKSDCGLLAKSKGILAELDADHLAISRADCSINWIGLIKLLVESILRLRFIGSGPSLRGSMIPFDPGSVAKKLLGPESNEYHA